MSSFYTKFLREENHGKTMAHEPLVCLAAFGKHPGWDDHIEDIGMETESLVLAKQLVYLQGIGGLIDTGAWEKLSAEQQLPGFHHVFVWQRAGQYLVGRLWSSIDGKGRARYPMVICAHIIGLPLEWAMALVLPELERIQKACEGTRDAREVRNIIDRSLAHLRQSIPMEKPLSNTDWGNNGAAAFTRTSADKEAFLRVLHQFRQQISTYQEACRLAGRDFSQVKPQQIRVPATAGSISEAFLLWEKFVYLQLPADTVVLFILPWESPWMDITLGEPGRDEFFCLRAGVHAIPLASNIPYQLEADLPTQGDQILLGMSREEKPWRSAESSSGRSGMGNRLSALLADKARKVIHIVRGR